MKKHLAAALLLAAAALSSSDGFAEAIELTEPGPETSEARVIRVEETEKAELELKNAARLTPEEEKKIKKVNELRKRERMTFDNDSNASLSPPTE